jgi:hypothetical protein
LACRLGPLYSLRWQPRNREQFGCPWMTLVACLLALPFAALGGIRALQTSQTRRC